MTKRRIGLCGLLALLLVLLTAAPALAETLRFGTVDGTDALNLRERASSSSKWLGSYEEDTWVRILGESGNFYRVRTPDGKTGYMSKNYIYLSSAAMGTIGIVDDAGFLNLRKSPSLSSQILAQYDDGTPCLLLSESSGWYHVSVDGLLGYFDGSFIRRAYMPYSPDVATIVTDNGGSLRMRQGPGTSYSTLRSFNDGAYVMILQKGNGWWKVTADGKVGYMDSSYLHDGIIRKSGSTGGTGGSGSSGGSGGNGGSLGGYRYAYVSNPGRNEKLNLRQTASTKSKSLGKYENGTKVILLDTGSTWCRVQVDGLTGYMMRDFLSVNMPDNTPSTPSAPNTGVTGSAYVNNPGSNQKLNLRKSASKNSKSLGKYGNGTPVTVVESGAQWCKVIVGGKVGYMMTDYLTLENTSSVPGAWVDHPDGTYVNLRKSANKNSSVLVRMPHGSAVTVLTPGSTWTKVRYLGYTGYMMTRFLDD